MNHHGGVGVWERADVYERFMGRWSRVVARTAFDDAAVDIDGRCLDVGCGVGSLSATVLDRFQPDTIVGIDRSAAFLEVASQREPSLTVVQADASRLPFASKAFDAVVSGLVLNFVPDPQAALGEIARVARPGGTVLVYVWDYDYPDFFLTRFWQGMEAVRGRQAPDDERGRWPVCSETGMRDLVLTSALLAGSVRPVVISCVFDDADELWEGFLLGVGPAGRAVQALTSDERARLRTILADQLPLNDHGRVELSARAWTFVAKVVTRSRHLPHG